MTTVKTWLGHPYPLGATWLGNGVNFSLFSEHAAAVDLCLFDNIDAGQENIRIPMTEHTGQVWHLFLPEARPGQLYSYRVSGPYDPDRGLRFNNSKLLIDPYAKAIAGKVNWADEMFGYTVGDANQDMARDFRDDAWGMPKSVVIDTGFDWGDDRRPQTPLPQSVIYELHVKGFTKFCPGVPEDVRGTYAGLGTAAAIDYLKNLGVTAVELLPVHAHIDDKGLLDRGLTNYWGYNTIGFFAPHAEYSSSGDLGSQVNEFKWMVRNFHAAGIEVIVDVVYNHTGEGNQLGPTLSFRGIDNAAYYRLSDNNPAVYLDYTGCGNSLNVRHPHTLQLIMDSLRYWIDEMHVDGFRFDLASALARELHDVDRLAAFFDLVQQDPLVSQVKLIAEPWDVGEGGYQVGRFPPLWTEWNGKYRDTVRDYWRGEPGKLPELASRLTGSSDLYETSGRRPVASVNFVTCHDGFTLADLVSYDRKHNEANGENNHDGSDDNRSWNCGTEGPTDDAEINALRKRQVRNFLVTLFFSQGIPMLLAGDELGRTQQGNNNSYCQDNEISWVDWDAAAKHSDLIEFVATLSALRRAHPVLRRRRFFSGQTGDSGDGQRDIIWLTPSGDEMNGDDWNSGYAKALAVCVNGDAITEPGPRGERITDSDFVLLINAHSDAVRFSVPASIGSPGTAWQVIVDTGSPQPVAGALDPAPASPAETGGDSPGSAGLGGSALNLEVAPRAIVVLRGAKPAG